MNHASYRLHRAGMRNALGIIKRARLYDAMADNTNNVQRQREESTHAHLRVLARQHADLLPKGTDPLGFRAMHAMWDERRKRVEYRVRCRRHDAELRARARYGAAA
jgi:hypothetical protein